MGVRKRRRSLSNEEMLNGGKQLKMDFYLNDATKVASSISSFPLSNRFSVLSTEQEMGLDRELVEEESERGGRQLGFPEQVSVEQTTRDKTPPVSWKNKRGLDFLAEQTSLISDTIINLYMKIDLININLEKVKSSLNALIEKSLPLPPTETGRKPGKAGNKPVLPNNILDPTNRLESRQSHSFVPNHFSVLSNQKTIKNSRCLLPKKIALLIGYSKINIGRWDRRSEVIHSLCQILGKNRSGLDITDILWLPNKNFLKRVVISCVSDNLPSSILSKRNKLRDFLIFPMRVFEDSSRLPLCKPTELRSHPKVSVTVHSKCCREFTNKTSCLKNASGWEQSSPTVLRQDHLKQKSVNSWPRKQKTVSPLIQQSAGDLNQSPSREPEERVTAQSVAPLGHMSDSFVSMPSLESSHCSSLDECLEEANPITIALSSSLPKENPQEAVQLASPSSSSIACSRETNDLILQMGASGVDFELDSSVIHSVYSTNWLNGANTAKSLALELLEAENQDIPGMNPVEPINNCSINNLTQREQTA